MKRIPFILLFAMSIGAQDASPKAGEPPKAAEAATSQPYLVVPKVTSPLNELVRQLDSNDPLVRETARDQLMLLTRDDLRRLLTAAREASPLRPMQVSQLREVAQHVFLTEIHQFKGDGSGFIGIPRPPEFQDAAVIPGRIIGYDGFRVLRDGDTIVGLQARRGPGMGEMTPIATFENLLQFMQNTRPGDWIVVRLIRNGQPMEVTLHLAGRDDRNGRTAVNGVINENPYFPQAEKYWRETFLPGLNAPTTRPAS